MQTNIMIIPNHFQF